MFLRNRNLSATTAASTTIAEIAITADATRMENSQSEGVVVVVVVVVSVVVVVGPACVYV